jgi:hypothetical protein
MDQNACGLEAKGSARDVVVLEGEVSIGGKGAYLG